MVSWRILKIFHKLTSQSTTFCVNRHESSCFQHDVMITLFLSFQADFSRLRVVTKCFVTLKELFEIPLCRFWFYVLFSLSFFRYSSSFPVPNLWYRLILVSIGDRREAVASDLLEICPKFIILIWVIESNLFLGGLTIYQVYSLSPTLFSCSNHKHANNRGNHSFLHHVSHHVSLLMCALFVWRRWITVCDMMKG